MTATHAEPVATGRIRWRRRRANPLFLAMSVPGLAWYLVFLLAPLVVLLVVSLGHRAPNGGYAAALTLEQYLRLGTRWVPFVNTVKYGFGGTLLCLLVAYPMAYAIATRGGKYKTLLLTLIVVPFWTSFLIRTYAWVFLLGNKGIPAVLEAVGIAENVRMLNTPWAVLLGIVYNYLPLMVLPIYVSLERVEASLRQASKDLGAGPVATFLRVTLPLSAPGVVSGILLVFVPVLGEYLIPVLLGGGQTYFLGNALADLFFQSRNWPFGAAVAMTFIILIMTLIATYRWFTGRVVATTGRDAELL